MRNWFLAAAGGIVLASCGGGDSSGTIETEDGTMTYDVEQDGEGMEATFTGPDGEVAQVQSGPDAQVNLPDGFTIYPGAEVVSTTTVSAGDGEGALVLMSVEATQDEVIAFYRQQAEAAGVVISGEMNTNGMRLIGGESEDGLGLSVSASAGEDGRTAIQLTVGRGTP
jgi:hypothetical protein